MDDAASTMKVREALRDLLSGWEYIRKRHGDLPGVGWDRAWRRGVEALELIDLGTMPHGRMPSASGGTGVGQTDDGALTSGPGMRARNAEGSPASSPPNAAARQILAHWIDNRDVKFGDDWMVKVPQSLLRAALSEPSADAALKEANGGMNPGESHEQEDH